MARRYSQPQGAAQIDLTHPLAKKLLFASYDLLATKSASGHTQTVLGTGCEKAPISNGLGVRAGTTQGTTGVVSLPTSIRDALVGNPCSFFTLTEGIAASGNAQHYYCHRDQSTQDFVFAANTTSGQFVSGPNSVFFPVLPTDKFICATLDGTTLATYTTSQKNTYSFPYLPIASSVTPSALNRQGGGRGVSSFVPLLLIWNRVLSAEEVASLTANPWQIFKPVKPALFAATAGSPGLTAPPLTNSQTFYSPTVTPGAVALTAPLLTNAQAFYGPTVTQGGATQTLTAPLVTNGQTFYSPAVAPGAVTVSAPLLTNTQTFYGPTATPGAVAVTAPLLTNTSSFFGPSVSPGAVALTAPLLTNTSALYTPTIINGTVVSPPYFENPNSFFAPTITPGAVTLTASLFTNTSTVFPARIVVTGDELTQILQILRNRQELNPTTGKFVLYDDDGVTVLREANAWEDAAGTIPYRGQALRRLDALH